MKACSQVKEILMGTGAVKKERQTNLSRRPQRAHVHSELPTQTVADPRHRQKAPGPQDDTRRLRERQHFQATRQLGDLISIGPAMLRDFEVLGIRNVAQLARQNPRNLYEKLGRVAGQHQDICVLDVFCAAVAQARNPRLPTERCQWWYWSRKRKQRSGEAAERSRKGRKKTNLT